MYIPNISNSFKPELFADESNFIFSDKSITDPKLIYNVT